MTMNKQFLPFALLFLFSGYYSLGQCPVGIDASIVNVVEEGENCTFDVEMDSLFLALISKKAINCQPLMYLRSNPEFIIFRLLWTSITSLKNSSKQGIRYMKSSG